MGKIIMHNQEIKGKIREGVNKLADTVSVTIGPRGRNVVLKPQIGSPLITNDGVTIAKEVELDDPFENVGAELVKEVSSKTNDVSGDGTTTATILARDIINRGYDLIEREDANPIILRKGMFLARDLIVETLKEYSKPIQTSEDIAHVGTISSADEEIGKLIAQAMETVGKDGVITVEEAKTFKTTLDTVEGLSYDKGYLSPYMVTDSENKKAVLENPYLLVTNMKIFNIQQLIPLLQELVETGRPLLLIAEEIDNDPLATLVVNKLQGNFNVVATKAPGFGEGSNKILEDIATLTGATFITEELGMKLEDVTLEHLGESRNIEISEDRTVIVDGKGNDKKISERILSIREIIENDETTTFDKEQAEKRLAKMTGGVAVIKVGASTETEMIEKKLRIEDALNATKAAVEEGIVPGGGIALLVCQEKLDELIASLENKEEKIGASIIYDALSVPFNQIIENCGFDPSDKYNKLIELGYPMGYDALNNKFVDMFEEGIVDPTKVTRSALENAISISATLLTTEAGIVHTKK